MSFTPESGKPWVEDPANPVDDSLTERFRAINAEALSRKAVKFINGQIDPALIPVQPLSNLYVVSSQAAMLALNAKKGDLAKRTDIDGAPSFILQGDDPTVLGNWTQLTGDYASNGALNTEIAARQTGDTNTLNAAKTDATTKANAARDAAVASASTDATSKANTAQQNAIDAAATDATTKDTAVASAAATDAQNKANSARDAAISTASGDATTKANAARTAAISAAATDASTKADAARDSAVATAATDAQSKADAARDAAIGQAGDNPDNTRTVTSGSDNVNIWRKTSAPPAGFVGTWINPDGTDGGLMLDQPGGAAGYTTTQGQLSALDSGKAPKAETYITPEYYGAVGNGIADDTAAVQAAVNASGNGRPALLVKQYRMTAMLRMPSNSWLHFNAGSKLIRGFVGGSFSGIVQPGLITNAGQTSGGNDRITITGSGGSIEALNSTMTGKVFCFFNASRVTIRGVNITSYYGDWASAFKNVTKLQLSDCVWEGGIELGVDGIHCYGVQDATIANMVVYAGDDALALTTEAADCIENRDIVVTNCVLKSNKSTGIKMVCKDQATQGTQRVQISNCTIVQNANNGFGVFIHGGVSFNGVPGVHDITLSNITIDASAGTNTVFQIGGLANDGLTRITVDNLTIQNPNTQQPVVIQGSSDIKFRNLSVYGQQKATAVCDVRVDASTDVSINGGTLTGAPSHSILVGSGGACTDVSVVGMTIANAGSSGVRIINASGTRVTRNRIKGCANAFSEVSTNTSNTLIEGNDLRGNTGSPSFSNSTGIIVRGNVGVADNVATAAASPTAALYLGSATYRESIPAILAGANLASPGSGVMQVVGTGLLAGDTVSSLSAISGTTALTAGTNNDGHIWFALYDPSGNLIAQTADQTGTLSWTANTIRTIALPSTYTVTTSGLYYIAVMVNIGTGGTPVAPSYRGFGGSANINGSAAWPSGRKTLAGTSGSGLTTTAPATLSMSASANALYVQTS